MPKIDFSSIDYAYDFSRIDYSVPEVDYSKGPNGEQITIKEYIKDATGNPISDLAKPFIREQGFDSDSGWKHHGLQRVFLNSESVAEDGKVILKENYSFDDKAHGWSRSFYQDGSNQIKTEATYVDDVMHGVLRRFNPDGAKTGEAKIVMGKKHGQQTSWHPNGSVAAKEIYVHDKRHGLRTLYYPTGKKLGEVWFINGLPYGQESEWHDNGQLKMQQSWVKGKEQGPYIEWHENGAKAKVGQMKDGEEVGAWTGWHPNGQKSFEVSWVDGLKDGNEVGWYDQGSNSHFTQWKMGVQHGKEIAFYAPQVGGGVLKERSWNNGKLHGKDAWYNPDGTIKRQDYYENGIPR